MSNTQSNSILAQLAAEDLAYLTPYMKLLSLKEGDVLFEPGQKIEHYYFPISCSLELSIDMSDGRCGGVTFVDSICPVDLVLDGQTSHRGLVHHSGQCVRIPVWVVHERIRQSNHLLWLMLNATAKIFRTTANDSMCLRLHTIEQVTAKLILLSLEDSTPQVACITHQEIANTLGARREGVTNALGKFKAQHLISTGRGHIELLDRSGLERMACECYRSTLKIKKSLTTDTKNRWHNYD